MQLSKRLQAIADMISPCNVLADVGTDHGYIPIYAVEQHIAKKAIAMDINRGPIERAASHIAGHGLEAYIETRCCDGVAALGAGEADCVVIAGMGGGLMQKILEEGSALLAGVKELILQPQSEIGKFRFYLAEHGYAIVQEDMILEDGKFYPMMKAVHGQMKMDNPLYQEYGMFLLKEKHPVLRLYLEKSMANCQEIQRRLQANGKAESDARMTELKKEMQNITSALEYYEM